MEARKNQQSKKSEASGKKAVSRYIPVETRKILKAEYGTKCAIPHCQKPSKTIHHTARFAISQSHNPYYLAPICREHHNIAHTIDQKMIEAVHRA